MPTAPPSMPHLQIRLLITSRTLYLSVSSGGTALFLAVVNVIVVMMMIMAVMTMGVRVGMTARGARVLTEHQRLDRDGDGLRRHPDASEVDVVEIPQYDSVDDQDFAGDLHFIADYGAERLGDVAVEHDVQGFALRDRIGEPEADARRERRDALIRRRPLPAERERRVAFAFGEVEGPEVFPNRPGELFCIDLAVASIRRLQHLQVSPGQQFSRGGHVDGIAAQLNAVLRRPQRRSPNAFSGGKQRPGQGTGIDFSSQSEAEQPPHIAKIPLFAPVEILGDTPGKHDAVD